MSRKIRFILFVSLTVLFLIAAPLAVFYSLGWRLDWQAKKITRPGTFYFKIQPREAQIYLEGKLKKKTDFFFSSAFIENLTPKKYEVEIKKDGHYKWTKNLEIKSGEVTEAKNIILFPENPSFEIISEETENLSYFLEQSEIFSQKDKTAEEEKIKEIGKSNLNSISKDFEEISQSFEKFKLSPSSEKLAYFNEHEIWILFLNKKYEQPQKEAGDKIFLTRFSEKISRVFWLDNYYLLFNAGNEIKIAETDDRDEINIITLTGDFENPDIFWDNKNKKLYVLSNKTLYLSEKLIP